MTDKSDTARRGTGLAIQALTLARIPLAAAFAIVVLTAERTFAVLLTCLGLIILAELTDLLDGTLARRFKTVSEWGAMLDPYADSVSRLVIYWSLASAGLVIAVVPLAMAVRDVTVAYCRIVLAQRGKSVSANWSGKAKAVVQSFGSMLAVLGPLYWKHTGAWTVQALSWTVIVVTAASVFQYARAALSASREVRLGRAGDDE